MKGNYFERNIGSILNFVSLPFILTPEAGCGQINNGSEYGMQACPRVEKMYLKEVDI